MTNALHAELAGQSTLVVGAHFAYVDTAMTEGLDVPKSSPGDIAERILDALEDDARGSLPTGSPSTCTPWVREPSPPPTPWTRRVPC
ncbi:hypothetical protein ACWC24_33850 [Streptomyces sp. NPDC001443]